MQSAASVDRRPCPLCGEPPRFRGIACAPRRVVLVIDCGGCGAFRISRADARLGPFEGEALEAVRRAVGGNGRTSPAESPILTAERIRASLAAAQARLRPELVGV
jgi:hypothetical protein